MMVIIINHYKDPYQINNQDSMESQADFFFFVAHLTLI